MYYLLVFLISGYITWYVVSICLNGFFEEPFNKAWDTKLKQLMKEGTVVEYYCGGTRVVFKLDEKRYEVRVGYESLKFGCHSFLESINKETVDLRPRASFITSFRLGLFLRKLSANRTANIIGGNNEI